MKITKKNINIPLTVPKNKHSLYLKNYLNSTYNTGNFFIFSGDQKIEHLNHDFSGKGISKDDATPEHLFKIASKSKISALATQMGLLAQYGSKYSKSNYIIKMNSKTNLVKTKQSDPNSSFLYSPEQAIQFSKQSGLKTVGLAYTVYLGSEYESLMLREAADTIYHAHQNGMLAILWMYPRGKSVSNEKTADIIAGAAGVGACLGADFVKINPPENSRGKCDVKLLKQAILAAGKTKILCSGGSKVTESTYLKTLSSQIKTGTTGTATGRNIHQRDLSDAVKFCNKIAKIIFG